MVKQSSICGSIFGCLYDASEQTVYNGFKRANDDFLKALIRYSSFREIHIFCEKAVLNSMDVFWAEYIKLYGSDKKVVFLPAHELYRYFSSTKYEAFHHGNPSIGHLATLRDSYSSKLFPLTGRAHTLSIDSNLSKSRDLLLSPLKRCDAILCSSQAQKIVMKRLLAAASASISDNIGIAIPYKGEVEFLPMAVEPNNYYQGSKFEARELLGYSIDRPILLTLGKISHVDKMDLHPLLLVLNDLVELHGFTDALLVIAGDGEATDESIRSFLKQAYMLNLENNICFELSIDDERKNWLFAACDIFISLADNIQKSFGLAPLEAMLHGVPVILSDWNGYSELVEDGKSGFLIKTISGNYDELSRPVGSIVSSQAHLIQAQGTSVDLNQCVSVIWKLLSDINLLHKVGKQGRERVLQCFCWEQAIEKYHELVKQLNKEAEQLSCASSRSVGIPYQQVFAHYPSEQVSDDMLFITTDRGVLRMLGSESNFFYSELDGLLKPELINLLANDCLSGVSVAELKASYKSKGVEPHRLVFTIMWMYKYQLLKPSTSKMASLDSRGKTTFSGQSQLARELATYINCAESHRFKLIEPVLAWFDKCCESFHGLKGQVRLRSDLINYLISKLDDQLLQAIGWISDEIEVRRYADVLDHIISKGGIDYLAKSFPLWYRLNRRLIVRMLIDAKRLFERFNCDLIAINDLFKDVWDQSASNILRIKIHSGHSPGSVVLLELDNGHTIIYKNRDLKIDYHIVGFSERQNNIAGCINRWLPGETVLQTHRILPRDNLGLYGYCEYISPGGCDNLSDKQASSYYHQLGVLSGLTMLLGLGDLHHRNLVSSQGRPYLVDAKVAFSPLVMQAFEAELAHPLSAFARGMDDCSLQTSGIRNIWESFYYSWLKACSYNLCDGVVQPSAEEQYSFHFDNLIVVGERTNMDTMQPAMASLYDHAMEQGIRSVIEAVSDHCEEWSELLFKCKGMQVGHLSYIDREKLKWQQNTLMTYRGFQLFSQKRLKGYFSRMAKRLCLCAEEVQRWMKPEWKEPNGVLFDALSKSLLSGYEPRFARELGSSSVITGTANGNSIKVTEEMYFQCDPVGLAANIVKRMSDEPDSREQFIIFLTAIFKQWLNEQLKPNALLPDELKNRPVG